MDSYDFMIVGGGSAGCVMASRRLKTRISPFVYWEAGVKDSRKTHLSASPVGVVAMMPINLSNWTLETVELADFEWP